MLSYRNIRQARFAASAFLFRFFSSQPWTMRDPLQMHDMQSIYLKNPDDVSAVVIGSAIDFLQFAEKRCWELVYKDVSFPSMTAAKC